MEASFVRKERTKNWEMRSGEKVQTAYTALRPSEKNVADYLLAYRGRPGDLLMEELSRDAKVSQPTIVRFVKALGYKGFQRF